MKKDKMQMVAGISIIALAAIFLLQWGERKVLPTLHMTAKGTKEVIVIDPGHGGYDPGKIGVSGTLEKDLNLAIAQKVADLLEKSGYTVYLTRETDVALCQGTEKNKKTADLKRRLELIQEIKPALVVSIHQNSYNETTKGAQAFYYANSVKGKELAKSLQDAIKKYLQPENARVEKGNDSYYMLKKTEYPLVIMECGFLSNPEEEALLKDENYQKRLAFAISQGVENFLYK